MSRLVKVAVYRPDPRVFGENATYTKVGDFGAYADTATAEFLDSIDYKAAEEVIEFNMTRSFELCAMAVGWRIEYVANTYEVFRVAGAALPRAARIIAHGKKLA